MKTRKIISRKILMPVLLFFFTSAFAYTQEGNVNFGYAFYEQDGVKDYIEPKSDLISSLKFEEGIMKIVVFSSGEINSIEEINIKDSILEYHMSIYDTNDSLIKEKHGEKTITKPDTIDSLSGYYECFKLKVPNYHSYFKNVEVYYGDVLVSRILFEGVHFPNAMLPKFEPIRDLNMIFSELE